MAGPVNVVFFHIDVTGSEEPVRPLHIGAVDSWGESEFEAYVWPEMGIQPGASHLYTEDGELYRYIFSEIEQLLPLVNGHRELRNEPLPCLDLEDALLAFMDWLGGGNILKFDFAMLRSFEGGGLGRSCCPWLPETAGEGASAQLGGVPDLLRRGDLRLHGQPGRCREVGPLRGVPQPGGDAEAAGLGLQRGR